MEKPTPAGRSQNRFCITGTILRVYPNSFGKTKNPKLKTLHKLVLSLGLTVGIVGVSGAFTSLLTTPIHLFALFHYGRSSVYSP